jgi:DNA polymerase-3 subunit gamma/tau
VDVLEIDGASNRGIEEIRQLRQNVNVRPSRARYKIYIIDEVHMLTREAFNALLKTLEEPPRHVKFIFATTEPNKIPLTILSRCQRFDFSGIDASQVRARLARIAEAEGVHADPEALDILARRGAGSMRDSQSLLEQLLAGEQHSITAENVQALLGIAPAGRVFDLLRCLVEGDAAGALSALDGALADGVEPGLLLDQLMGYLRDAMAAAVGSARESLQYAAAAQVDEVTAIGRRLGLERILAMLQILDQSLARMRAALDGRILAEMAVVRMATLEWVDAIPELIARLRARDEGASAGAPPSSPPGSVGSASKKNESGTRNPSAGDGCGMHGAPLDAKSWSTAIPGAAQGVAERGGQLADSERAAHELPQGPSASAERLGITTLEPHSTDAVWHETLAQLSAQAELVADQAALADRITLSAPDCLVATFPEKYTSCKLYCEMPEHRAKLEETLQAITGKKIKLQLRIEENGDARWGGPESRPRPPSRRQIQAQVGARPFVRQAMELFDAGGIRAIPPGT